MLLITLSQGLSSNFDVNFRAGVMRFSQNRFWAGGAGCWGEVGHGLPSCAGMKQVGRDQGQEPGLGQEGSSEA